MGIKFGGLVPNRHYTNIGGFKFGGVVWYRHTYIRTEENLVDINLVGDCQTAKFSGYMVIHITE